MFGGGGLKWRLWSVVSARSRWLGLYNRVTQILYCSLVFFTFPQLAMISH